MCVVTTRLAPDGLTRTLRSRPTARRAVAPLRRLKLQPDCTKRPGRGHSVSMLDNVWSGLKRVVSKASSLATSASNDAIDTHHHTVGAAAFPNLTTPYVTRACPTHPNRLRTPAAKP